MTAWTCRSYELLEVTRALQVPPHPPALLHFSGAGWRVAVNEEAFCPLGTRKYLVAFNGEALLSVQARHVSFLFCCFVSSLSCILHQSRHSSCVSRIPYWSPEEILTVYYFLVKCSLRLTRLSVE